MKLIITSIILLTKALWTTLALRIVVSLHAADISSPLASTPRATPQAYIRKVIELQLNKNKNKWMHQNL